MRHIKAELGEKLSTIQITPPVDERALLAGAPSVQFAGSEGFEWIIPQLHVGDEASTIAFESWVFGRNRQDKFATYCADVVQRFGATDVEIKI